MTVSVDEIRNFPHIKGEASRYGTLWCHLTCGGDCEELHRFAEELGLKRRWAQHMEREDHYYHHYDLVPSKRKRALRMGAVFIPAREQAAAHLKLRRLQRDVAQEHQQEWVSAWASQGVLL